MPKLSVIIPVYNLAPYISKCVESVLFQDYQDWELLLVDDGSKDESGIICDEWASKDSRISVIHLENGGVSRARNVGLKVAKGEYVAFVDGDDWIETSMYATLIKEMENDVDIVFCRFLREYPEKSVEHYEKNLENLAFRPFEFRYIVYEQEYYQNDFQTISDTVFGSVCRSLFKKTVIDKEKIVFPEDVKIAEDRIFLMNYLRCCEKGAIVDEYFYHYRAERVGSAVEANTTGYQNKLIQQRKNMLKYEFEIINNNNYLSISDKEDLITYEKYKLCFDVVINEMIFNVEYRKCLKQMFRDELLKGALPNKAFKHMKKTGVSLKRRILYFFIKMKWWDTIYIMLQGRRKGKR